MAPLPGRDPLEDGVRCQRCTCKWCGYALREGSCWVCPSRDENSSIDAPNTFNDLPNDFTHPPQPHLPELLLQLSNDSRTIAKMLKQREEKRIEHEQAANLAVQKEQEEQAAQSFTPYWNFPIIDDDNDDEYTI
ncbi:hypothetical protein Tco_1213314 [Tanacetum coccineum]